VLRETEEAVQYFEYENVVKAKYISCNAEAFLSINDSIDEKTIKYDYFLCEAPHYSLCHWVCEFFIPSLPLLQHFMKEPHRLFVLFGETFRFMTNFLLSIGITTDRIIDASDKENGHVEVEGPMEIRFLKTRNSVICPPLFSLHSQHLTYEVWRQQYLHLRPLLPKRTHDIPYLFFKRNPRECTTSRGIPPDEALVEDWVLRHDGTVIDPFHINNIRLQQMMVRNAKVIITLSGSNYYVNGMFADGSVILCLDEINLNTQILLYVAMKATDRFVREHNEVHVFTTYAAMLSYLKDRDSKSL
jgi:hypothetical protein